MDLQIADLLLFPLGAAVSLVGTLVGVGGGFYAVPYLMLVHDPDKFTPELAAATSLAIIFVKAGSATVANAQKKRIDWRVGILFGLATVPGAFIGPFLVPLIPVIAFKFIFAGIILVTAIYLVFFSPREEEKAVVGGDDRHLSEADGTRHDYQVNIPLGIVTSLFVGFIASMTGVGGGVIHMPLLVLLFAVPPRIASATSQLILMITAGVATGVNFYRGTIDIGAFLMFGLGGIVGAQLAVLLASRVSSRMLKVFLSIVMVIVASQLILKAFGLL